MMAAAIQLIVLMAVFTIVEGRWPAESGHKWWRRPLLVDICSWLIHPLSISAGISLAVLMTNGFLALMPGIGGWRAQVAESSFFFQAVIAIIVADFLSYWIHRAYHRFPALWAFHVVHHTSEELDWLSTSRLHPVSQILNTAVVGVVLLFAGLSVGAVVVANVIIGAAALLVHANVNWTFGPFRHLVVSPLFHHWHHARVDEGPEGVSMGNYGAIFSIWDRIFGTWTLPAAKRPEKFGVKDAPPQTPGGLLLHPLRVGARSISKFWRRRTSRA